MRKGLLLALAMAVMAVLMAAPVCANAPTVKDMPQLIMSDEERSGGNFLMMYPEAFGANCFLFGPDGIQGTSDDELVVSWNNDYLDGYGTASRFVWIGDDPTPGANATDIVAMQGVGDFAPKVNKTQGQWDALQAAGVATLPAPAADGITAGTPPYYSLTLVNNDYGLVNGTALDPDATGAVNAAACGVAQPASFPIGPTDLIVLAAVTSATTGYQTDWSWLTIYTMLDMQDGTSETWQNTENHLMSANGEGWIFFAGSGTGITPASSTYGAQGVGFSLTTVPTNDNTVFGAWFDPDFDIVPGDASTSGSIYRIVATIAGSAASAEACPSYRLVYMNQGFSHMGGVAIQSKTTDTGSIAAPFMGNPVAARLYFRTAYNMSGMEDGGIQATYKPGGVGSGADYRPYTLRFDLCLDKYLGAADAGSVYLSNFTVQSGLRSDPAFDDANNAVSGNWGAGAGATSFVDNWGTATFATYTAGTTDVIGATACDVGLGGSAGARGLTLQPIMSSGVNWMTKKLVRLSWTANSLQNVNLTPQVQAKGFIYDIATGVRGIMWGDYYGGGIYGKPPQTAQLDPRAKVAPGCPKQTGATVESYFFMHNNDGVGDIPLTGFFFPQFSVVEDGIYGPGSAWEYPSGGVRFTNIKIVDLGTNF